MRNYQRILTQNQTTMAKATDNIMIFRKGLEVFSKKTIKPYLRNVLSRVAERFVGIIDGDAFVPLPPYTYREAPERIGGNDQFPVWKGHMRDATGLAVYIDGTILKYIPTAKAEETQSYDGRTGIIGNAELQLAISEASTTFSSGIWIVLFSSVPYAYEVNTCGSPWGRGVGYFDTLENELLIDLYMNLKPVSA